VVSPSTLEAPGSSPHTSCRLVFTPKQDIDSPTEGDVRCTFASLVGDALALKEGVHPKIVSERLGHATVGITLDLYSHVTPAIAREAADTVGRDSSSGRDRPDRKAPTQLGGRWSKDAHLVGTTHRHAPTIGDDFRALGM